MLTLRQDGRPLPVGAEQRQLAGSVNDRRVPSGTTAVLYNFGDTSQFNIQASIISILAAKATTLRYQPQRGDFP